MQCAGKHYPYFKTEPCGLVTQYSCLTTTPKTFCDHCCNIQVYESSLFMRACLWVRWCVSPYARVFLIHLYVCVHVRTNLGVCIPEHTSHVYACVCVYVCVYIQCVWFPTCECACLKFRPCVSMYFVPTILQPLLHYSRPNHKLFNFPTICNRHRLSFYIHQTQFLRNYRLFPGPPVSLSTYEFNLWRIRISSRIIKSVSKPLFLLYRSAQCEIQ